MMLDFTNYPMMFSSIECHGRISLLEMVVTEPKGRNLRNLGKFSYAMQLMEKWVKIQKIILEGNHLNRLSSQHELASAYQANGQIREAVELLKHVVKFGEKALTENHPDQLASQHQLARAYKANGQIREAVELSEHVVKFQEEPLTENHPDRLASQYELASAY
jgi:tetratricopeptide (TPR) repeat protein